MVPHVITNAGLTVTLGGKTHTVAATVKNYSEILGAIYSNWDPSDILNLIEATRKKVEAALKLSVSLVYNGGCIYHNGVKLRGYAVGKLVALVEAGKDTQALANFLTKVQANPDQSVIDNLYSFLEVGKMPITPNGNFVAYKAINADWNDIHSGKVSNKLGNFISMPRKNVDSDRNRTCSYGYHVCSFDYLKSFAVSGGHIVACEVNPADVVAIPSDYNDTKMRVSAYWVIDEVTRAYDNNQNVLSTEEVYDDEYEVSGRFDDDEEGDWEIHGSSDDFETAVEAAEQALEETYDEVKIENSDGVMVFYKKG